MRSPTQLLADVLLDEPVEEWVLRERQRGSSWRRISLDLRDKTDGRIDVTATTVLTWASTVGAEPTAAAS